MKILPRQQPVKLHGFAKTNAIYIINICTEGIFSDVKGFYIDWTFLPAMDEDIRFHLFSASAKWYTENVNEQT